MRHATQADRRKLNLFISAAPAMLCALLSAVTPAAAQTAAGQYRAFWVDTFNTSLNTRADVAAVVANARAAGANAIFAQVRRRGDAWYLNSLEPPPDFTPIAAGFDPLADLIAEAHAARIEVHAFVIVGAIWNKLPTLPPSATGGPPLSSNHVFNLHGGFDSASGRILPGPNNWLTRTLLPDQNAADGSKIISMEGYRFGSDFWLDFGHPDAEAYTVSVLTHLVKNYDLDGLHLDRIRYPEISVSGQTPSTGASVGYNDVSVARFQRRYGITPGSPPPAASDPLWAQWRRDQVTNLVRRVYLNALALKPRLKVSAALIAFGNGPVTEDTWTSAEAYWRVYQDWRAWTQEGILDVAAPMVYKTEHTAAGRAAFDQWAEWVKNHQYNRAAMIGIGGSVNAVEGTLRQTRRALAPSAVGLYAVGVIFYSMATSNVAVSANPYSIPTGQNTPARPFAELASGLVTGKSADGTRPYEDQSANPTPVFAAPAAPPVLPWKESARVGHLMGFVKDEAGAAVDAADVTITRVDNTAPPDAGRANVATVTDGGGFYGGVDLAPGRYRVTVTEAGRAAQAADQLVTVVAGQVATFDVTLAPDAKTRVQFQQPAVFDVPENAGAYSLTIERTGDTSGAATVEYATLDNTDPVRCDARGAVAYARCDYATLVDTLQFAPGETSKKITVSIIDDAHVEDTESVRLILRGASGAVLGGTSVATLRILDDDLAGQANPLTSVSFFVRQHYLDFLSREPEAGEPWTATLNNCAAGDIRCDRISVSAAFFGSPEFRLKGFYVFTFYRAAFGRLPSYDEIVTDMRGVTGQTPAEVYSKRAAFAQNFVRRAEFAQVYGASANQQFVDALLARYSLQQVTTPDPANPEAGAKVTLTRADLINQLSGALTRAQVLRAVVESDETSTAEANRAFVAMQYYGYLRRSPEEPGYTNWLRTIERNPNDYRAMVNGFLNSTEYRLRFGQP